MATAKCSVRLTAARLVGGTRYDQGSTLVRGETVDGVSVTDVIIALKAGDAELVADEPAEVITEDAREEVPPGPDSGQDDAAPAAATGSGKGGRRRRSGK